MSKSKPLHLTADLTLASINTEWTAEEGDKPRTMLLRGGGVSVEVEAPPNGVGIANHWRLTLEEIPS